MVDLSFTSLASVILFNSGSLPLNSRIAELSDHDARNSEFRRNAQDNPEL